MNTTRLKLGVFGAIVVASAAIWGLMQRQADARLRAENDALRQQLEQASELATENARLSNLVALAQAPQRGSGGQLNELLRLRGEVGRLRQQSKEIEALREANRQASAALAASQKAAAAGPATEPASADYWPKDAWQFLGYATPDAAMQSQFYAASRGEVKAFLASVTDEMQKRVEKDFEGKTESEMVAKMKEEMDRFQSVRVLNREDLPDDTAALTVAMQGPTGTENAKLILRKTGNDWKLAKVEHP
jgi:hypothetical protein